MIVADAGELDILLVDVNPSLRPIPPLGLEVLASALSQAGFRAEIFSASPFLTDYAQQLDCLRKFHPRSVGLQIRNYDQAILRHDYPTLHSFHMSISRALGKLFPTAPLIVGGIGFSIDPQFWLNELNADFGIVGSGELPLTHLLGCVFCGVGEVDEIPGVVLRGKPRSPQRQDDAGLLTRTSLGNAFNPQKTSVIGRAASHETQAAKKRLPRRCDAFMVPLLIGASNREPYTKSLGFCFTNVKTARSSAGSTVRSESNMTTTLLSTCSAACRMAAFFPLFTGSPNIRHPLSENPVRYELVADGQRRLDAFGNRAIYTQIASHLWRDSLLYGALSLQSARFHVLIGAMFAIAKLEGSG